MTTKIKVDTKIYHIHDQDGDRKTFDAKRDHVYEETTGNSMLNRNTGTSTGPFDEATDYIDGRGLKAFDGANIKELNKFFDAMTAIRKNPLSSREDYTSLLTQLAALNQARQSAGLDDAQLKDAYGRELVSTIDHACHTYVTEGHNASGAGTFLANIEDTLAPLGLEIDLPTEQVTYLQMDGMLVTPNEAESMSETEMKVVSSLRQQANNTSDEIHDSFNLRFNPEARSRLTKEGARIDTTITVSAEGEITDVVIDPKKGNFPSGFLADIKKTMLALNMPATSEEIVIHYPVTFGTKNVYLQDTQDILDRRLGHIQQDVCDLLHKENGGETETKVTVTLNPEGRIIMCDAEVQGIPNSTISLAYEQGLLNGFLPDPPTQFQNNGMATLTFSIFNRPASGESYNVISEIVGLEIEVSDDEIFSPI